MSVLETCREKSKRLTRNVQCKKYRYKESCYFLVYYHWIYEFDLLFIISEFSAAHAPYKFRQIYSCVHLFSARFFILSFTPEMRNKKIYFCHSVYSCRYLWHYRRVPSIVCTRQRCQHWRCGCRFCRGIIRELGCKYLQNVTNTSFNQKDLF